MKKHLLFLIPFFTCVLISQSLTAQQELKNAIASTAQDYESNDITKFKLDNNKKLKSATISNVYIPIAVDETAFDFKVSKAFGSYVIPNTNYLRIVSPDETNYTKAEFVNKKTGKQIFSFDLDIEKNVVDMSFTKSGIYTLILTNLNGDRYTEDIMIM
ncbi:MAG: hypothetical protein ACJA1A_002129 [Saprospiraceae bacterium]|jgi:hypothetical protein|tara:strand:+ start:885 stop:1358 length:474 start_codon:yes stop_codon:yes gene_type:complete